MTGGCHIKNLNMRAVCNSQGVGVCLDYPARVIGRVGQDGRVCGSFISL